MTPVILNRAAVALCLLAFSLTVNAAPPPANRFEPGATYYFDTFNPGTQPWEPGPNLNIEEVFKNYQYYEIVFGKTDKEITVNHYVQGRKANSEKYRITPNRTLRKE